MNYIAIGERLKLAIKGTGKTVEEAAKILGMGRTKLYGLYEMSEFDADTIQLIKERLDIDLANEGQSIRRKKSFGEGEEGISFVPISAQAGYSQRYMEPLYINQLEQVHLPGMPYKGAKYRIFEVSGDSMEPTLKEHQHIVAERIEPDYWDSIARYYIYVIVTDEQIMVKRIYYEKGGAKFILISDNKDFYPQFAIEKSEIKELWVVKRKMDWEMPPPAKVEIDQDLLK